jgi:hypothetical protein
MLTFELAEKSATGKVERRWLSLFGAAMDALAIFAPARRLLSYALDLMHRSLLRRTRLATARQEPLTIDAWEGFRGSEDWGEFGVRSKPLTFNLR